MEIVYSRWVDLQKNRHVLPVAMLFIYGARVLYVERWPIYTMSSTTVSFSRVRNVVVCKRIEYMGNALIKFNNGFKFALKKTN